MKEKGVVLEKPSETIVHKSSNKTDISKINITALAYIGDAVHELYVRSHVLGTGKYHVDALHKDSVKYVSANGQSFAVRAMCENFLTESENTFIRKAKNKKIISKPKNVTPISYKWATAFEALIGFLYMSGEIERVEQIIIEEIRIVDTQEQ